VGEQSRGQHYHYFAIGNLGQYIYVIPEQQLIFVRFGKAYGNADWPALFEVLSAQVLR
jgi:hypothetical protein